MPSSEVRNLPHDAPPVIGGGGTHRDLPPKGYGGGDNDPDDARALNYRDRLRRCRLGITLSMVSVSMLFIALTFAFKAREHVPAADGAMHNGWMRLQLPFLLVINTIVLLLSSFTLEMARRKLRVVALFAPLAEIPGIRPPQPRALPWLGITLVLGFGFLFGQAMAWRVMALSGFYLQGNPSSAFFYLLTGAHAVHLAVGLLALCYAAIAQFLPHRLETRCLVVDVTSWYWHFMAVLWLYIYGMLWFAR